MPYQYQAQLTPEQIQFLTHGTGPLASGTGGGGMPSGGFGSLFSGQYGGLDLNGTRYGVSGITHNDEGGASFDQNGFSASDPNNPDTYMIYGKDGRAAGLQPVMDSSWGEFLTDAALIMAAAFTGGTSLSAMAAGEGAAGAAAAGGAGGFLGEGVASGIPAWDAAATSAGMGLSGATAAGTAATELGSNGAFLGEGVASGVPAWDAAAANAELGLSGTSAGTIAGNAGGASGATAGGGSGGAMGPPTAATQAAGDATLQSQLAPYATGLSSGTAAGGLSGLASSMGISPSMLGTGASLLGGLLGSKGVQSTQTTTKDIPDWLKPYVMGQGGLLDSTSSLLQKQMSPQVQGGYDQMRNTGLGLLNGTTRFGRG